MKTCEDNNNNCTQKNKFLDLNVIDGCTLEEIVQEFYETKHGQYQSNSNETFNGNEDLQTASTDEEPESRDIIIKNGEGNGRREEATEGDARYNELVKENVDAYNNMTGKRGDKQEFVIENIIKPLLSEWRSFFIYNSESGSYDIILLETTEGKKLLARKIQQKIKDTKKKHTENSVEHDETSSSNTSIKPLPSVPAHPGNKKVLRTTSTDEEPKSHDIIIKNGKSGRKAEATNGDIRYNELVKENVDAYNNASKKNGKKNKVIIENIIRPLVLEGRKFFLWDTNSNCYSIILLDSWKDMEAFSCTKVQQKIRDISKQRK
jgi:hypothetical protein